MYSKNVSNMTGSKIQCHHIDPAELEPSPCTVLGAYGTHTRAEWTDLFTGQFDTNSDGFLSRSEMAAICSNSGGVCTPMRMQKYLWAMDVIPDVYGENDEMTYDGTVDASEFSLFASYLICE